LPVFKTFKNINKMESEFDYKAAAEAIINRLGGTDETRRKIWNDEKDFRDSLLPDAIQGLFPDAVVDMELFFSAVIDYIKLARQDPAKSLIEAKKHMEKANAIINDLLFYRTFSAKRKRKR
jgi:ribosomal protein L7/L12